MNDTTRQGWGRGVWTAGLAVIALLAGCVPTEDAPVKDTVGGGGCTVDGTDYAAGESFPSADGCNTCSCGSDGQVACTLKACATTCEYAGKTYVAGDSFPSDDGCNTCSCSADGLIACTAKACAIVCQVGDATYLPGDTWMADCNTCSCDQDGTWSCSEADCTVTCTQGGVEYQPGESFPAGDGCNTCTCQGDGTAICTQIACAPVCVHDGVEYAPGDSFPAGDGCNTCTCQGDGMAICTEIACAPICTYKSHEYLSGDTFGAGDGCGTCTCLADGKVECIYPTACTCEAVDGEGLDYVGNSVVECADIDFDCPTNTTFFENDCGCGCEQDPSCPNMVNCKPTSTDPACSDPEFSKKCPYTYMTKSPIPACCGSDADCGGDYVCAGGVDGEGICKLPAEGNACWADGECGDGETCQGAWTCPCNADCDGADEPGTCQPNESECKADADCPSGKCIAGPLCTDLCVAGDPFCCSGNTCAPSLCEGAFAKGCGDDSICDAGTSCVMDGACHPSVCSCDPLTGEGTCTADCQPGSCQPTP